MAALFLLCSSIFAAAQVSLETNRRPSSYGLVIDNSGSYRTLLERVISFSHALLNMNTDGDETFLVTFVDPVKIRVRQELTTDKVELGEAIDNMFVEGGFSGVIESIKFSIDYLRSNARTENGREKALLLISDGDDDTSSAKVDAVIALAKESRVRIVVVGLSDEKVNTKLLERLAKGTGGATFYPRTPKETLSIVPNVAAALRGN